MDNDNLSVHLDRLKERFLLAAARGGRLDEVASLIELGADLDYTGGHEGNDADDNEAIREGEEQDTPLIAATRGGHYDAASLLLASGADPNRVAAGGSTALHIATAQGHVELCGLLVANGANDLDPDQSTIRRSLDTLSLREVDSQGSTSSSKDELSGLESRSSIGSRTEANSHTDEESSDRDGIESVSSDEHEISGTNTSFDATTDGSDPSDGENDSSSSQAEITTLGEMNDQLSQALLAAEDARDKAQYELEFYFGGEADLLSTLSLDDLDSMETKLRSSLDRVVKEKESQLKRRLANGTEEMRCCVVCMDAPKTVLLLPCRHLCVCSGCSQRQELTNCPICRLNISSKIDTYS